MDAGIQAMDGNWMVIYMPDLTLPKRTDCHPWTLDWLTTSLWFGLRPALRASKFAPGEFVGILAEMTGF